MRILTTMLLAGAGALALTGAAAAHSPVHHPRVHRLTIPLPGGGIERIAYTGDVAPRVEIVPVTALDAGFAPFWSVQPDPMLANFEQVAAAMDREADAMLRQAAVMMNQPGVAMPAAGPNGVWRIDARDLPPGAQSYTFSETLGPAGVCAQSMTITPGPDGHPHVVTHQSGSCGNPNASYAIPDTTPDMTAPPQAAGRMEVKTTQPATAPYGGTFREAAYQVQQ